ncbi:centrosomal protein of 104 kDa isoform X2 [Ischnura elegans]|uniref:centrosomal protein of 104 kDa isoform X2 n=1 Tax=Ischnura elegans TaxID=197161 RepID=UPI001ED89870|nr:centrosomal protein of 104 kDa isoform X2 [Ischnura elegans]
MPHKIGFTVVYASGEDENHRARELECHGPTVRGWQSSRHCTYPQEIVLRLDTKALIQRVQILTHQYLIPERVEFFVGNDEGDEAGEEEKKSRDEECGSMDPPEGAPRAVTPHRHNQPPIFTHLGYVPLSNNEATGFKARELKSVSVSCTGRYLRLLLHSNHQNALNTWNQVGLVAVNLLGEELEDNNNSHHAEDIGKRERAGSREEEREAMVNGDEADRALRNNCHTSSSQSSSSTSPFASPSPLSSLLFAASRCGGGGGAALGNINENLPRVINSRNYTSPYDDLAFEMYVDTEVATIIRHMEIKKREAVEGERFEYARKLKLAMDELRSAGERLGRWALEKRKAADAEDFERARRKKLQMEEFRAHIYNSYKVAQLLEIHGPLPQNDDPDDPAAGAITMEQLGVPNAMPRHSVRPPLSPSRQQLHPGSHMYQNANCRQHQVQHRQCAACSSHSKEPPSKGNSSSASCHVLSHSPPPAHLPPPSLSPPLGPQGRSCTSPLGSPPSGPNQRTGLRGSQKKKKATVSPTANGSSAVKNSYEAYDERTLPALRHKSYVEDAAGMDEWAASGEGGCFRLSDREKRQATLPIAVFGLTLVEKFYSKQFTEREEGLQMLREELLKSSKIRCQSKGRDGSEPGDRAEERKEHEATVPPVTPPPPAVEESTSGNEVKPKEVAEKVDAAVEGETGAVKGKDGGGTAVEDGALQTNGEAKENGEEEKKVADATSEREARERTRQERVSANKTARASVFLLHRALKDKVFGVYSLATEVIRFFFTQFVPSKRVSPGEVSKSVERLLPELLSKSGDCAPRVHNLAMNTIIRMSECKEVREQHLIPMHITKPITSSTHPRLALSRAEMAEQLILRHGISTEKQSGLTCRVLSELGNSGLHHPTESVRKASERILIQVYQVNPRVVRKLLPPEDDLTRRNLLYRHLFQEFERIDVQRKKDMLQKSKAAAAAAAAAAPSGRMSSAGNVSATGEMTTSVDTISYPSPAHTVSSSSSTSSSSIMTSPGGACSGHAPMDAQSKAKSQAQSAWQSRQHLSPVPDATSEERMCVFCLERNKAFASEEGLNLHYWRNCPMLTRCSHCRQVIEVSALSAHLIGECDAHQMYKQCSRCKLAISVDKYDEHLKLLTCAGGENMVCPLCHKVVQPNGEDGWRAHLKGPGPGQCTSQSRRRHGRGKVKWHLT